MTQEDKDLLLKDLCARLPYGVRVKQGYSEHVLQSVNMYTLSFDSSCAMPKPYLRPMSSMTTKERWKMVSLEEAITEYDKYIHGKLTLAERITKLIDWYNTNHFDYNGLIEKSLALEAPKGMYD